MHNLTIDELIRREEDNPNPVVQQLIKRLELVNHSYNNLKNDLEEIFKENNSVIDLEEIQALLKSHDKT